METTLILRNNFMGQYLYRVMRDNKILVDWQYGTFERESTIAQAKERFSIDKICNQN